MVLNIDVLVLKEQQMDKPEINLKYCCFFIAICKH